MGGTKLMDIDKQVHKGIGVIWDWKVDGLHITLVDPIEAILSVLPLKVGTN